MLAVPRGVQPIEGPVKSPKRVGRREARAPTELRPDVPLSESIDDVVRRHEIDYLRSALRGDRLEVRTHVANVMAAKSERQYDIVRTTDEIVLARAVTTWGFIDITSGRPMRIPAEVYVAFGFPPRVRRPLA